LKQGVTHCYLSPAWIFVIAALIALCPGVLMGQTDGGSSASADSTTTVKSTGGGLGAARQQADAMDEIGRAHV